MLCFDSNESPPRPQFLAWLGMFVPRCILSNVLAFLVYKQLSIFTLSDTEPRIHRLPELDHAGRIKINLFAYSNLSTENPLGTDLGISLRNFRLGTGSGLYIPDQPLRPVRSSASPVKPAGGSVPMLVPFSGKRGSNSASSVVNEEPKGI